MAEKGVNTSEFRWGALTAAVTAFGEPLGLFNTDMFAEDPVLNLIFRSVQMLIIGGIAIAYMFSRSNVKVANGHALENATEVLAERVKQDLNEKK